MVVRPVLVPVKSVLSVVISVDTRVRELSRAVKPSKKIPAAAFDDMSGVGTVSAVTVKVGVKARPATEVCKESPSSIRPPVPLTSVSRVEKMSTPRLIISSSRKSLAIAVSTFSLPSRQRLAVLAA